MESKNRSSFRLPLLRSALLLFCVGILFSCGNLRSVEKNQPQLPLFKRDSLVVARGDTLSLTLNTANKNLHKITVAKDPRIQIIKKPTAQNPQLKLVATGEGKGPLVFRLDSVTDSVHLYVGKENLIKVVAVGNSFSEDALENPFLWKLFAAAGRDIYIVNGYIPGAGLSRHIKEQKSGAPAYSTRKIYPDGERSRKKTTLQEMLSEGDWDYISLQQVSQDSGKKESFSKDLPLLYRMVDSLSNAPKAKYVLHQTWAYGPGSTHDGFVYYERDQEKMFRAIESAYRYAAELIPTHRIVPAGRAVQNLRQTGLFGKDLTRDGYHLEERTGMLVAACTWYMALTGEDVRKNPLIPEGYSMQEIQAIKQVAYNAFTEKISTK